MTFDMNALMKQAQEAMEQMQRLQQEATAEEVKGSAGGGMVTVTATAGGEIKQIAIDPKAIDPSDPEMLADLVIAAVNQALEAGRNLIQAKVGEAMPPGLGGLLPGM
ncbi:MAG TPA: YbaB/EbfC family nucleoid-associated protein [Gaiellaceae bacterium]|jgi:DNA-binding YbaB/EbfC family protein|nr:YbaB/EbfC family nucleoid-associated protein [Gaiellaceae bacterium]